MFNLFIKLLLQIYIFNKYKLSFLIYELLLLHEYEILTD